MVGQVGQHQPGRGDPRIAGRPVDKVELEHPADERCDGVITGGVDPRNRGAVVQVVRGVEVVGGVLPVHASAHQAVEALPAARAEQVDGRCAQATTGVADHVVDRSSLVIGGSTLDLGPHLDQDLLAEVVDLVGPSR